MLIQTLKLHLALAFFTSWTFKLHDKQITKIENSLKKIFENEVAFWKTELTNATHGMYILLTITFQEW